MNLIFQAHLHENGFEISNEIILSYVFIITYRAARLYLAYVFYRPCDKAGDEYYVPLDVGHRSRPSQ